jgi:hypothetical protein
LKESWQKMLPDLNILVEIHKLCFRNEPERVKVDFFVRGTRNADAVAVLSDSEFVLVSIENAVRFCEIYPVL